MIAHINLLDSLGSELALATDLKRIKALVRQFTLEAGLSHAAYRLGFVPGWSEFRPILFVTYPEEWVERYYAQKYFFIDPVVAVPAQGILPIDWASFEGQSPAVRTLFGEAREHGLGRQGLTIPVRGCIGEMALTCFTSDETDLEWSRARPARLPLLHMASFLIHDRVMELFVIKNRSFRPPLSPRELDCLKLCAAGVRDAEIGKLLNISSKVVNQHLDNVRYKLNASTRPNAIARAIRFALITTDLRCEERPYRAIRCTA